MVKVTRWWNFNPINLKFDSAVLQKRPRIDYRVSEYVFEYVNKNIFIPYGIMQIENYEIFLSMDTYDIKRHKYYFQYVSPYSTDTTKFSSDLIERTNNGKKYVQLLLECCSMELNECTKPINYANIVYDMFSDCLVRGYKKTVKGIKEITDRHKNGMNYALINQFEYPAPFENQKYLYDTEEGLECMSTDGVSVVIPRPENIPINMGEEYKRLTK